MPEKGRKKSELLAAGDGLDTDRSVRTERIERESGPPETSAYYTISTIVVKGKYKYCSFYEMANGLFRAVKPVQNRGSRDAQTSASRDSAAREAAGHYLDSAGFRNASTLFANCQPLRP
jgi:hypothetical protein